MKELISDTDIFVRFYVAKMQSKHTDESLTQDFYLEIKTWTTVQTRPRVDSAEGREQGEI